MNLTPEEDRCAFDLADQRSAAASWRTGSPQGAFAIGLAIVLTVLAMVLL